MSDVRVLGDGTQVVAITPDVLVENLADWRNDHEGGGGEDKPRVYVLRDGSWRRVYSLPRNPVTGVFAAVCGANIYRVYADDLLWIEAQKADVIEALDIFSDLADDSPTPAAPPIVVVETVKVIRPPVGKRNLGLTRKASVCDG